MAMVRPAAVAGYFYPGDPRTLADTVKGLLAGAKAEGPAPKAIIAPHAGYVYSGAVAASAYARVAANAGKISRVILIGPAHRVAFRGLAVPSAETFATPLGEVPVDRAAVAELLKLPFVKIMDEAHGPEHSLEVHLPFLQALVPNAAVVPIVAGHASAQEVAQALDAVWGGPETLIVVSSDLSHYLDYETARRVDAATTEAIEHLRFGDIGQDQACGRVPIVGLLALAQRRGLTCNTVDVRNSGDTAGGKDRVVGYGSYLFFESDPGEQIRERHGETLLEVARASITHGLERGRALPVNASEFAAELRESAATFVTLKIESNLRGCVGSLHAWRALVHDVSENAYRAAFADTRFKPLTRAEWPRVEVTLSILTVPELLPCGSEAELVRILRPGSDGVILADGDHRGLFLPIVWEQVPDPTDFVRQLKRKAGLAADHWAASTQAYRFTALSIPRSK